MKFQPGDIIINPDPGLRYDSGIIIEVHNGYYITHWFSETENPVKNNELYTMHTYLLLTDIFRESFNN